MSAGAPPGGPVFGGGDDDDISPGTAPGVAPNQDLEDLYMVRVGLDTGDMQAGARAIASQLRDITGETTKQTMSLTKGFAKLNKLARLFGVSLTPMGLAAELLKINEATAGVRKSMYETTREATMGGGALMKWARDSEGVFTEYLSYIDEAQSKYRINEKEAGQMFAAIARSGVATFQEVGDEAGKLKNVIVSELGEVSKLGFQLEFLGLDPKQIESLFHSMATNLRMDVSDIRSELHQFFMTVDDSALTWQDHTRYVIQAFEQYSRFGISLQEVHQYLLRVGQDAENVATGFQNIGASYDAALGRLNVRQEVSMDMGIMMLNQIRSEGMLGQVIGEGPVRDQFARQLTQMQRAVPEDQRVTITQLLDQDQDIDLIRMEPVWQAMRIGQMGMATKLFGDINVGRDASPGMLRRFYEKAGIRSAAQEIQAVGLGTHEEREGRWTSLMNQEALENLYGEIYDKFEAGQGIAGVTPEQLAEAGITREGYIRDSEVRDLASERYFNQVEPLLIEFSKEIQGLKSRMGYGFGRALRSMTRNDAQMATETRDLESMLPYILEGNLDLIPEEFRKMIENPLRSYITPGGGETTIDMHEALLNRYKHIEGITPAVLKQLEVQFEELGGQQYRAPDVPMKKSEAEEPTSMGIPGLGGDGFISVTANLYMGPNEMITFNDVQTDIEYKNRRERSRSGAVG